MNLTRNEAETAMREGKKVVHDLFLKDEWITSTPDGKTIICENGARIPAPIYWLYRNTECWDMGWQVVEEK